MTLSDVEKKVHFAAMKVKRRFKWFIAPQTNTEFSFQHKKRVKTKTIVIRIILVFLLRVSLIDDVPDF